MLYDIVVNNGTIIEPKREVQTVGNIGIKDGKIAVVCREKLQGKEMIDARNKIVCPGFIDIHSHLNFPLYPVWLSAKQGITTCLSGNCGMTPEMPIKAYLESMEEKGYPINFATLVGHSWTLREMAGIRDPHAAASPSQIEEMTKIAERALEEGAFGISLGLEYAPGAAPEEYMPLAELASKFDKLVAIHIRTDALDFARGLKEAISISEQTGARVQISHLAYQFGVHPEVTQMALCMIDNAAKKNLPVLCDSGIYEAFATFVKSAVFDDGWHERYGCQISDLMISTGKYAGQRATPEMIEDIKKYEEETVGTAFVGVIPDLALAIKQPYTMISTDAGLSEKPGNGHPQDAGTFPRVFQRLVREQGALSVMEAVKKSSYMPAKQMGISDTKGWIGTGADADLVVLDIKKVKDNADYVGIGRPDASPSGIEYVIVNGVTIVSEEKAIEDRLPGKILRQKNKVWTL
ncbi:amidohydrolase family protein [Sinanaerobacter chloroacetimidivorans]|uniref:Amidohydrolase family protein n=1 Tax=Sinanaerobacter chloroacetimidivorans TaxID=2818044 RepID=A0A8J8B305_9FIRM|nr:amidohydrolase family protein [Sinanaerobacter chloroacetimidivorans]MBR0599276.1 amidohydrolase family protein [Sinanaerobacter chloroacetimidivorans]